MHTRAQTRVLKLVRWHSGGFAPRLLFAGPAQAARIQGSSKQLRILLPTNKQYHLGFLGMHVFGEGMSNEAFVVSGRAFDNRKVWRNSVARSTNLAAFRLNDDRRRL